MPASPAWLPRNAEGRGSSSSSGPLAVDDRALAPESLEARGIGRGVGRAEQQEAATAHRGLEGSLRDLARGRREVDQNVAAGDDIEATARGRRPEQIGLVEANMPPDVAPHHPVRPRLFALGRRKKPQQRLRNGTERRQRSGAVETIARLEEPGPRNVRPEYVERPGRLELDFLGPF